MKQFSASRENYAPYLEIRLQTGWYTINLYRDFSQWSNQIEISKIRINIWKTFVFECWLKISILKSILIKINFQTWLLIGWHHSCQKMRSYAKVLINWHGFAVVAQALAWLPRFPETRGPFCWHGLTGIPSWISNHTPSKVSDEINDPFLNFNGCTVEVKGWISNFIQYFIMDIIAYPC